MAKVWNKRDPQCPADAIYVGRPTVYGNQFEIGKDGNRAEVLRKFEDYVASLPVSYLEKLLQPLRGKDLVCWCSPKPCHADLWLDLANIPL